MAWVLRWRLTTAMAASYAAAAAAVMYFLHDAATAAAVLVILFALVLLAGNVWVRAGRKAPGALPDAQRARGGGDLGRSTGPAPGAPRPDIETRRR